MSAATGKVTPAAGLPSLVPLDVDATMQHAAYTGAIGHVAALLAEDKSRATAVDGDGRTPLHWAASGGRVAVMHALLAVDGVKAPAHINHADESGWTALTSAAAAGHVDAVQLLLDHGADANLKTETGTIALHHHKGNAGVVAKLAPATKDVNAKDETGGTPLHRAAGAGHAAAVAALLSAGAKVDPINKAGKTPLHLACEEGRLDVALLLIDHGASGHARDRAGATPPALVRDDRMRATITAAVAGAGRDHDDDVDDGASGGAAGRSNGGGSAAGGGGGAARGGAGSA